MNLCERLEDLLPLHAVGDTSVEEGLQVEEHVAICPACRADMALYARMVGAARNELAPEARAQASRKAALSAWRPAAAAALLVACLATGIVVGRWSARHEPLSSTLRPGVSMDGVRPAVPLSIFSPVARERLSRVARAENAR